MPGMKEAFKKIRSLGESFVDASKAGDAVDQIVAAFETLGKLYARMMKETQDERAALKKEFKDTTSELRQKIDSHFNKMQHGPMGPKGDKGEPGLGVPGIRGEKGKDGEHGKNGSPDTPEQVRDKLEKLRGKERLSISAIDGLSEELKKRSGGGQPIYVPTGGGGGGHLTKSYDLSSQLNGVLTSFSLPSFHSIIAVMLAGKPVLRLTTDYTVDGALMTIAFTSEIQASTDLAAGQSLIVLYAE